MWLRPVVTGWPAPRPMKATDPRPACCAPDDARGSTDAHRGVNPPQPLASLSRWRPSPAAVAHPRLPGPFLIRPARDEVTAEGPEGAGADRLTDAGHQAQVVGEVVDRVEPHGEQLLGHEEVAQVGAAEGPAGVAGALRIQG